MNNTIINWIITIVEGLRPELAAELEDIKAMITSGKPVTVDDIKKAVDDGFAALEVDVPNYANSLKQTDLLLNQALITEQAWATDIANANKPKA